MTQDTEDVVARLEARCSRAEDEYPRLAAPDGTVAVPFTDLRALLTDRQSLSDRIDVLEAENARHVENQRRAFELASKLSRPFDGGSDNHGS